MNDQEDTKPQIHTGADHSAPYPVSRLAPGFGLVNLAREIEQADAMINTTSHAKLRVIADQILKLKEQARTILQETKQNQQLHHAQCQFKKIPGKTYHLYLNAEGQLYFSMLSPEDWGDKHRDSFQGSYTLQADMSWKTANETEEDSHDINLFLDSL